jgi:CDP-glucose 4,6-dehydratase
MSAGDGATFVTGASGLLGGRLVAALVQRGERVVVLRRDGAPMPGTVTVRGDVTDAPLMARTVAEHGIHTIYHLAAQTIVGDAYVAPAPTFAINIQGTWAVLEAARAGGVRRVVVAGSGTAYGEQITLPYTEDMALRPRHPYEVSKAAADLIACSYWHTYGLPVAVTRLTNVYGGGDRNGSRLIPELVAALLDGRTPSIRSDGTPERDFVYVDDAVAVYLAIAEALDRDDEGPTARGEAFNAGGGRPVSVRDVVATLGRVAGVPLEARYGAAPTAPGETSRQYVDIAKIERVTGWRPAVDLEEGLRRTLAWHRAHRAHRTEGAESASA